MLRSRTLKKNFQTTQKSFKIFVISRIIFSQDFSNFIILSSFFVRPGPSSGVVRFRFTLGMVFTIGLRNDYWNIGLVFRIYNLEQRFLF